MDRELEVTQDRITEKLNKATDEHLKDRQYLDEMPFWSRR